MTLEEALPGIHIVFIDDYRQVRLVGLEFDSIDKFDSSQRYSSGCDQYVLLDWRIHAQYTIDVEKYMSFSSEDGVFAKIIFKNSLCLAQEETSIIPLILYISAAVLALIIIIVIICCRVKRCYCFATLQIVINEPDWVKGQVECSELKKKPRLI